MLFNSFDFLLFFTVVFAVQWCLPHRPRNVFLLLASCFFYACWDWRFLGLLWVTILTDYTVSRLLERTEFIGRRKLLVGVSCAVNLSPTQRFNCCMVWASVFPNGNCRSYRLSGSVFTPFSR